MRGPTMFAAVAGTTALLALAGCGGSSGGGGYGGGGGSTSTNAASTTGGASSGYGYGSSGASTTAKAAKASRPATVGTTRGRLGTYLVDASGRTLYLWKADRGSRSTCSGACAQGWPPLLTKGTAKVTGNAKKQLIGTTKRSDGSAQVTYAGHPLYRYAGDTRSGQTNGQGSTGFGAAWYVVAPSGLAVTSR